MSTIKTIRNAYIPPASQTTETATKPLVAQPAEKKTGAERMDRISLESWVNSLTTTSTASLSEFETQQPSILVAATPKEDVPMFVEMKVDHIAKRIARGKKVSPVEMAYIVKHNQTKAESATRANEQRKMTELQLKISRNKEQMKAILLNATMGAVGTKESDYATLSMEGIRELKAKYLTENKRLTGPEHKSREENRIVEKKLEAEKSEEKKKRKAILRIGKDGTSNLLKLS